MTYMGIILMGWELIIILYLYLIQLEVLYTINIESHENSV